jgi:hypothetical protein
MYTFDPPPNGYFNTLQGRSPPGVRLVSVHSKNNGYFIVPGGWRAKTTTEAIIGGPDVQPYDQGLFPDQPQSWWLCLG